MVHMDAIKRRQNINADVYELPRLLRYHLRFFQLLGMHTLALQPNAPNANGKPSKEDLLLQCWSLTIFLIFSLIAACIVFINDEFLFRDDRFGYFNDTLKYIFAELAIVTIYAEALFRRKELAYFWRIYAELRKATTDTFKYNNNNLYKNTQERFILQLMEHLSFCCVFYGLVLADSLVITLFWLYQKLTRHLFLFWITFQPFSCFVHMRNMQFIMHIELLRLELVQLERELSLLVDYTRFASVAASFIGFEDYLRRKILEKQLEYHQIYRMSLYFQKAFGYSIVAVLLMIYLRVLVDFYFMYYSFYRKFGDIDFIMLLTAMLEIPAFVFASKSCMRVEKNISYQLHNIGCNCLASTAISLQIQNFSLFMLHARIRLEGLGLPKLDGYMLTRAVGSVTTYMIFYIQFMPKFRNP